MNWRESGMPRSGAGRQNSAPNFRSVGDKLRFVGFLWTTRIIMSETRTHEWRELCLEALSEPNAERRTAIVVELGRILRKDVHKFGPLRVDVGSAQVSQNGKPVYLTKLEFRLLRHFIERAGSDVSRDELLRSVWGYESGACTRTVDIHVHFLRHKLEQDARHPQLIVTVPGLGTKFVAWARCER